MQRFRASVVGLAVLLLTASVSGQQAAPPQQPGPVVSLYVAKVKKEKTADFVASIKKVVAANRDHNGSRWTVSQVVYGDHDTYYFTSIQPDMAGLDTAEAAFNGALVKAFGAAGAEKLGQDYGNYLVSSKNELRRMNMGLSRHAPDQAGLMKLVGESRWVRTQITRVRPGRQNTYTTALRSANEALLKAGSKAVVLTSVGIAGQQGTVYYSTTLRSSRGGFDPTPGSPTLPQALGEEGMQKYQQAMQDSVLGTEVMVSRYRPDLSNPPDEVVAAAPDFWRPKPAPAAAAPAKPKS